MKGDRTGIRAIRGPIILITVGVLFALQSFNIYGFDQTWPVLLIVIGLLSLLGRTSQQPPAPGPGVPPPPNYNWQQPPYAGYQSYSQSPYAQPTQPAAEASSGPAKGGFGTTAPPRDNPPGGSTPGGAV
jgi:predicted lipid-binding transport protein (Tim44 family)